MAYDYLGTWWQFGRLVASAGLGLTLILVGAWPERPAIRIAIAAAGLAAALYGVASLTGGWLGTAPWQWREVDRIDWFLRHRDSIDVLVSPGGGSTLIVRDPGQNLSVSVALALVGIAFVVVAAWPRYREEPPEPAPLPPPVYRHRLRP